MKKIEIIAKEIKIPLKLKIEGRFVDIEVEYHKQSFYGPCFKTCPLKEFCYIYNKDIDDIHFFITYINEFVWYSKQNIGDLCSTIAKELFNTTIDKVWPTPESMIKLNKVLGLVTDQKTTEEDIKILAELKNKLSSDAEKEDSKPKFEILL